MPHGFLSYNIPIFGMKEESLKGIELGTEWIVDLVRNSQDLESGHI